MGFPRTGLPYQYEVTIGLDNLCYVVISPNWRNIKEWPTSQWK